MKRTTTTGLSCRHISRVIRSPRCGVSGICSLPENFSRRCGPGMPVCPCFEDKRNRQGILDSSGVPFADENGILDPGFILWQHEETGRVASIPSGKTPGRRWHKMTGATE